MPRPDWSPLPRPGCVNVGGKVLLVTEALGLAMLRFSPRGTIDEHSADHDVDVVCLEGAGYASVEDEVAELRAGQAVRWPRLRLHRLWTGDAGMLTLVVEHLRPKRRRKQS